MNKKIWVAVIVILIIVIIGLLVVLSNNKKAETSNSIDSYIPEEETIADENEVNTQADVIELEDGVEVNRSSENVTIEVLPDTISSTSVEILITDNNVEHYGWGVEFGVQEKVDNEWKDLDYISDDLTWTAIAYELDENNQLTQKLDIEEYYGELNNGIYRIVKTVYDGDIYSNEFEIK